MTRASTLVSKLLANPDNFMIQKWVEKALLCSTQQKLREHLCPSATLADFVAAGQCHFGLHGNGANFQDHTVVAPLSIGHILATCYLAPRNSQTSILGIMVVHICIARHLAALTLHFSMHWQPLQSHCTMWSWLCVPSFECVWANNGIQWFSVYAIMDCVIIFFPYCGSILFHVVKCKSCDFLLRRLLHTA